MKGLVQEAGMWAAGTYLHIYAVTYFWLMESPLFLKWMNEVYLLWILRTLIRKKLTRSNLIELNILNEMINMIPFCWFETW